MDRFIFLDIDGVLNHRALFDRLADVEHSADDAIDPACVERVNRIAHETGAAVVVSSSWRHGRSVRELADLLRSHGATFDVVGKTPEDRVRFTFDEIDAGKSVGHEFEKRGDQIQAWLDGAGVPSPSFVILDDDADMAHLEARLVRTTFAHGITDEHVERAVEILRRQP